MNHRRQVKLFCNRRDARMPVSNSQGGFTYVELLVVIIIFGVLFSIGLVSYSRVQERSLDQRRKTDIGEIRAALEMYRSENNAYPTPSGTQGLSFGTAALTDGENTYMQVLPQDPQYPLRQYYYTVEDDDYTLATQLINPESPACQDAPGGDLCGTSGSGFACNYCLGSYGKK